MDIEKAQKILSEYNAETFHLQHAKTVSGVLKYFAKEYDPDREEFWAVAGLIHDLDFEKFPDEHCVKGAEILRENGADDELINAAMSHGWGLTASVHEPSHVMEKVLFAVDELTGLIWAAALMRPSKSVQDLELKSVKKKFKDKRFAAGCSREVIEKGAEMLGWDLDELIEKTILAMRTV